MNSLETRKTHTQKIILFFEEIKNKMDLDTKQFGIIIFMIHILIVVAPVLYLVLGKVNNIFYSCVLFWVGVIYFHFYFSGCFLTRLERHFFKDPTWYGPPILPFEMIGIHLNKNQANNFIYISSIIITIIISIKLFLHIY